MTTRLRGRPSTSAQLISTTANSAAAFAAVAAVVFLNCAVVGASTTSADRPPPAAVYLTHGMTDRVDCPAEAKPPSTLIVWMKNRQIIDTMLSRRLHVDELGALVIDNVTTDDAGLYTCTQYSPLNNRHPSFNLTVVVKGTHHLLSSRLKRR